MGIIGDPTPIIYFFSVGKYFKELSDSDITIFLMEESKGGKLVAFTETEIEQVMLPLLIIYSSLPYAIRPFVPPGISGNLGF